MAEQGKGQMIEMGLVLGCLYMTSKIDFTQPGMLFYARAFYGVAMAISACVLYYMYTQIIASKSTKKLRAKIDVGGGKKDERDLTEPEYDMYEFRKLAQTQVVGALILLGIHYYFKVEKPLLLQGVMSPARLLQSPLAKLHVFQWPVERPFKQAGNFMEKMAEDWAANADAQKDAIEEKTKENESKTEQTATDNTPKKDL